MSASTGSASESTASMTMAGGAAPSVPGLVTVCLLLALAAVGLARSLRRRLDPRCRAETRVFDRAGLDTGERRVLRRAARRLGPAIPPVSLLLAAPLLERAASDPECSPGDAATLRGLARRREGGRPVVPPAPAAGLAGVHVDLTTAGPGRTPSIAAPEATAGSASPHRHRTVSLLALAMASAEARRTDGLADGAATKAARAS